MPTERKGRRISNVILTGRREAEMFARKRPTMRCHCASGYRSPCQRLHTVLNHPERTSRAVYWIFKHPFLQSTSPSETYATSSARSPRRRRTSRRARSPRCGTSRPHCCPERPHLFLKSARGRETCFRVAIEGSATPQPGGRRPSRDK